MRFQSTARKTKVVDPSFSKNNNKSSYTPPLNHVKKLPIIGSILPQLNGVYSTPISDSYKFWPQMRDLYGDFYTLGLPALGADNDWYGTMYIITDPNEMVKVVRAAAGRRGYPSGLLEKLWVSIKWNETRGMQASAALFGTGPKWKRVRNFVQKDFMHPEAARGYIPGMMEAAKLASQGAPAMNKELNTYLGLCAFDLFSTIMFGELTKTAADPAADKDPENVEFVKNAMESHSISIGLLGNPYEMFICNVLGFETSKLKRCFEGFDKTWDIAQRKVEAFMERKQLGQLNENEQVSYLSRALDRQVQEEGDDSSVVSIREAQEVSFVSLFAAVDTTASMIGWNLFHIARFPRIQEKLYQELSDAVGDDGELTADVLDRKNVPYLHAVIRETQRRTPTLPIYINKKLAEPVTIHGVPLNAGDVVALEGFSLGMDPAIVDDPETFEPERWLPDAVQSRKGTPKEIIDHPFLKEPFSQGARRCPGSRVAANEVQVMISQLVLDWKMSTSTTTSSLKGVKISRKTTIQVKLPEIHFEARGK